MSDRSGRKRRVSRNKPMVQIGTSSGDADVGLRGFQVGSLPLLNAFLSRLKLDELLCRHLPEDDVRQELPTEQIILLLLRNVLVSREPLYRVPEWAACYSPELFDFFHADIELLHDDRLGKCLAKLYSATTPDMILAVVRKAIDEFGVSLSELHNDSTTVAFHGDYAEAAEPRSGAGKRGVQPAITWGHSKDHRPDLKQLLFTLTLANDGGVPVYFSVDNGNTNDDTTHRGTWDVLRDLVGDASFLYVADCKLASTENLRHIAARGGRFITVLPASRREDRQFRERLRKQHDSVSWKPCWNREDDTQVYHDDEEERPPKIVDVIRSCKQEQVTSDGFRLVWYHSSRKAGLDEAARGKRVQRAIKELEDLQRRLLLPRTRFRLLEIVEQAVEKTLAQRDVVGLLRVEIVEIEEETFKQQGRGRPSKNTRYEREVKTRFQLNWRVDAEQWRTEQLGDGVFPLLTNDRALSAGDVLRAYKRQPKIEKRFAQLKSDFDIAPVFLKSPERVLGLFTVYFLALLVQSLLERELRNALEKAAREQRKEDDHVALYPEGRCTKRPTARRVIDAFEPLRRHEITLASSNEEEPIMLFDELNHTQKHVLKLLKINHKTYGR